MDRERTVEAFCETCQEPSHHMVEESDPGTCTCIICGTQQPMMVPLG